MPANIKLVTLVGFCVFLIYNSLSLAQEPFNTTKVEQPGAMVTQSATMTTPDLIAAALDRGEIDQTTADLYLAYALSDYQKLPLAYQSNAPWSGTLPLRRLRERVQSMKTSSEQAEIQARLIAICGSYPYPESRAANHIVYNTDHFHIEFPPGDLGLPIENFMADLETTWRTQIREYDWAEPPVLPANPPPGNRYHVRVEVLLGGLQGLVTNDGGHAGFVGDNPNTGWNEGDAQASCMVLTIDTTPEMLQATIAREYNHAIQFGYGALTGANTPDDIFIDGGAAWMEDEVFDNANVNQTVLWPDFAMCMGEYTADPFAYWIAWRNFTEQYDRDMPNKAEQVMQDFWEETSKSSTSNMLSALDTALGNQGNTLAEAYHNYAIAAKFNKTCGGDYNYPYCFEEGANYVNVAGETAVHETIDTTGGSYSGTIADNYALNWISLPANGIYDVTLRNTSAGGKLRASLVCDTGSTLNITPLPDMVEAGSSTKVELFTPNNCNRVVAVITNQSQTSENPTTCALRNYELVVDAAPSPNLSTSSLVATPSQAVLGEVVTFTTKIANTGSIIASSVSFTNTLPAALQLNSIPIASSGSPPLVNGQTITWSGVVSGDNVVTIMFAAQLIEDGIVNNSVQIGDGIGNVYLRQAIISPYKTYIPLILKGNVSSQ